MKPLTKVKEKATKNLKVLILTSMALLALTGPASAAEKARIIATTDG